ncbi:hypothetical protein QE368_002121 [Asaia bogorensis NBRC 16594]|nr:hypothetical protein [Asaia bogorensis NBRC 16594]
MRSICDSCRVTVRLCSKQTQDTIRAGAFAGIGSGTLQVGQARSGCDPAFGTALFVVKRCLSEIEIGRQHILHER